MSANHKPATPLPWDFAITERGPIVVDSEGDPVPAHSDTAAYSAHAANAYPRLVEALRALYDDANGSGWSSAAAANSLLRELGEDA